MSFTYNFNTAPLLSYVRLLAMDTDPLKPVFDDDEINAFIYLTSSQAIYVSSMAAPTGNVGPVPVQVYSVYRAAALACDAIATSKARLAVIVSILDVKLDPAKAQKSLHDMAESYRTQEDNMGHFAIAEMVNNQFQARERVIKQFLRLEGD